MFFYSEESTITVFDDDSFDVLEAIDVSMHSNWG